MFTGIVEELGEIVSLEIAAIESDSRHARATIRGPKVVSDVAHGDSIAVNGVCLTVVGIGSGDAAGTFTAELMAETLSRTTASTWTAGTRVNLERSVTPTTRLGGHVVQGHVDGVGTLVSRTENTGYDDVAISVNSDLGRYIAPKGAVAVDGISLTVIDVTDSPGRPGQPGMTTFTLGIIPETRVATTMGHREPGDVVNIEADVMAKYAERLLNHGESIRARLQAVGA
jgi:riboflavin synthase